MENNECPKCGCKLKKIEEEGSVAWICDACGYGEATTRSMNLFFGDTNDYTIHLNANNLASKENLSIISKISGKNFIACKNILQFGGVVFYGKAEDVKVVKEKLMSANISFAITPEFPW